MNWPLILTASGAGLAAALGALPVLVVKDLSQRLQDAILALAAGVYLAGRGRSRWRRPDDGARREP